VLSSRYLKVTSAVAAIYPPTGWPRPRFLDQSPYTPHFVMFCLTLPFVCTAPDFSLSLCIQCFPRVFLVSSCCGEAVAQFLKKKKWKKCLPCRRCFCLSCSCCFCVVHYSKHNVTINVKGAKYGPKATSKSKCQQWERAVDNTNIQSNFTNSKLPGLISNFSFARGTLNLLRSKFSQLLIKYLLLIFTF